MSNCLHLAFSYSRYNCNVLYCWMDMNTDNLPKITKVVKVDNALSVKLCFKGVVLPLPSWFRQGSLCKLRRKSMLVNFHIRIKTQTKNVSSIFEEQRLLQVQKTNVFTFNNYILFIVALYVRNHIKFYWKSKSPENIRKLCLSNVHTRELGENTGFYTV